MQKKKLLVLSDGQAGDKLGAGSVQIYGNVIIAGAEQANGLAIPAGTESGAVYVFRYNGTRWLAETLLFASDGVTGGGFGNRTSISEETIIVGAHQLSSKGTGVAYIFEFNGTNWIERGQLVSSDAEANDWFGTSVALFGANPLSVPMEMMVVILGTDSGAAYLFDARAALP